jgi:hypothetical protein
MIKNRSITLLILRALTGDITGKTKQQQKTRKKSFASFAAIEVPGAKFEGLDSIQQ